MDDSQKNQGESVMFQVSKALLAKAQAALDGAANRDEFIEIRGTGMILCPREKQPEKGFEPYGHIKKDGHFYAFGPYRAS